MLIFEENMSQTGCLNGKVQTGKQRKAMQMTSKVNSMLIIFFDNR
jgi:hypothetical protein